MSEENQSGFKISDRRLFKADGTLREDMVIEEAPPTPPTLPVEPVVEMAAAAPSFDEPVAADGQGYPEEDPEAMPEQTLFTDFLMQIASSAFIYLGLVEHPATGRRQVDLGAAQESIEMLDMLREKTRGNLTRGEDKLFEELLADLKMQFVARRR
jgi:hypothetical protein